MERPTPKRGFIVRKIIRRLKAPAFEGLLIPDYFLTGHFLATDVFRDSDARAKPRINRCALAAWDGIERAARGHAMREAALGLRGLRPAFEAAQTRGCF